MGDEAAVSDGAGAGGGSDEIGSVLGGSSPKSRMKFLCSYGGKILPRATGGHLKYVGGETRFIAVPRDISLSELMKKLSSEFEGNVVLKYQVMPEDLDVLVSVRTNEDMKYMLDEYDRHEREGTAKLRAFLFPSNPVILENQNIPADPQVIEQCYIDAVNNTVRSFSNFRLPQINVNRPRFSLSACTSPKGNSPDSSITVDAVFHEPTPMNSYHNHNSRLPMHKVHSSPSLYTLSTHHHQTNNNHNNQHFYQHHQQHHPHGYHSSRLAHEPHWFTPSLSHGWPETGRAHVTPLKMHYSNIRSVGNSNVHNMGSGNSSKHGYRDDHSPYGCGTTERLGSLPPSPRNKILE